MAIAVFPVWRSPMMSSRWPRPIGIIASTALSPVCRGSVTGSRKITPGALRSSGIRTVSPLMSPIPSSGVPIGSTTLPTRPSPTGMPAIRPRRRTLIPSFTRSVGPRSTAPTLSTSRFITTALTPLSNSSSSPASALMSPKMRATPSLTVSTLPTSSYLSELSIPRSSSSRISEISLGFMLLCAIELVMFESLTRFWNWFSRIGGVCSQAGGARLRQAYSRHPRSG